MGSHKINTNGYVEDGVASGGDIIWDHFGCYIKAFFLHLMGLVWFWRPQANLDDVLLAIGLGITDIGLRQTRVRLFIASLGVEDHGLLEHSSTDQHLISFDCNTIF